jgi:hypothetical protein
MMPSTPRSSRPLHLGRVVDRPHVNLQTEAVRPLDEGPVDDGDHLFHWHLRGLSWRMT